MQSIFVTFVVRASLFKINLSNNNRLDFNELFRRYLGHKNLLYLLKRLLYLLKLSSAIQKGKCSVRIVSQCIGYRAAVSDLNKN